MYCMHDVNIIHVNKFCHSMYSHFGSAVDMVTHGLADVCSSPKKIRGLLLQF